MTSDKIQTWDSIIPEVKSWKERGEKVVFTNGCFDILHLGHADYLEKSRSLGDRLIVGVNTDASVKKLKGPERPVNPEYARARILAALQFVDAVILFDEDTPFELISHVIPDILVKGDDYKIENIVGADIVMKHGGEVKTISLVDGFSTTGIIGKIKTHNK
ncbi:D-glycero-beta-D-manno-heptose 1-phosphate adenylyltransferase [Sporocytophaga myxococcoides]|uniref:D-glycero-beta-D-manno-heptose 1-phosphate adenylyltransferase n=1 Tax=Sporocytophaga myxococcoides TaxID=153721 RepID=UPI000421773A|nr:D-glycero-beta-D-manno-heptose 1-phosphate adenylyltransferase [Sporocytophaga myxococcoides]